MPIYSKVMCSFKTDHVCFFFLKGLPARLEDPKTVTRDQTQESEAHEKADLRRLLDSFRPTPEVLTCF